MNKRVLFGLLSLTLACSKAGSPIVEGAAGTGAGGSLSGAAGAGGAPTGAAGTAAGVSGAGTSGAAGSVGAVGAAGSGTAGGNAAGAGGAAGTAAGGAAGGATAGSGGVPPLDLSNSVLERNKHPSRDGHFVQPLLTKAKAATMALDAGFRTNLPGAMWASPLYLENGPGGKGVFIAVTTSNDVFALDETTGAVVWTTNIGMPAAMTGVLCGNIHPLGILSTPVIDAAAGTLYVAGAIGPTNITRHEVHALSLTDGKERPGWPVDVTKLSAGALKFDPTAHNQRGALSLVGGILYVPYGGHNGDCGPYHGWVIAIDTRNPATVAAWATGGLGEAIWAAGGMVSDGNGVIAVTGNSNSGTATHLDSEEVVRVTGMATVVRNDANIYYPARWRAIDAADSDFGSNSPLLLDVPGATPSRFVVATAKDGHMYFLDSQKLGGMDGHVIEYLVATPTVTRAVRGAPASYRTDKGAHVVLSVDAMSVCPAGAGGGGRVVMSILVPPGAPPKPQTLWCVPVSGPMVERSASPIATTIDGKSEPLVWFMNGAALNAVDGDTGAVVYGGGADTCTGVRQWTSPIAVKGRIIVGGDGHLCSWSPHPP